VVSYRAGDPLTLLNDVVLFAVWGEIAQEYTVTFSPGSLPNAFATQITRGLLFGAPTPAAPVPSVTGWRFNGWQPVLSSTVQGDVVYVAQWEQITFTVRFVDFDGRVIKTETVAYGGSATAPTSPTRTGYTFTSWSPAFNNVISDLTVTAQYRENEQSTSSGGGGSSSKTPAASSPAKPAPSSPSTPSPSASPHSEPRQPPVEPTDTWALANLILSIAGIILALCATILVFLLPVKAKDGLNNNPNPQYSTWQGIQLRYIWLAITIVLAIVGLAVFLLTQNMNNPMVIVNMWTIANCALFAAGLITLLLTLKHTKQQPLQ